MIQGGPRMARRWSATMEARSCAFLGSGWGPVADWFLFCSPRPRDIPASPPVAPLPIGGGKGSSIPPLRMAPCLRARRHSFPLTDMGG